MFCSVKLFNFSPKSVLPQGVADCFTVCSIACFASTLRFCKGLASFAMTVLLTIGKVDQPYIGSFSLYGNGHKTQFRRCCAHLMSAFGGKADIELMRLYVHL